MALHLLKSFRHKFHTLPDPCKLLHITDVAISLSGYNYSIGLQVLSYDGLHPPDSLAITAAGIAVYAAFVILSLTQSIVKCFF